MPRKEYQGESKNKNLSERKDKLSCLLVPAYCAVYEQSLWQPGWIMGALAVRVKIALPAKALIGLFR